MDRKLLNKRPERILWVDLEMTGIASPIDDLILEVAAIVTDWDFKEIATYEGVIKNNPTEMAERMKENSAFWDANPYTRDELIAQNKTGKTNKVIEGELIGFINKNFKKDVPVLLGGNSIHVDRQFIINKWPNFNKQLHYRMLDVSAWKVVFYGKFKNKFASPDAHRAIDDIRGSIAELQYYLKKLK